MLSALPEIAAHLLYRADRQRRPSPDSLKRPNVSRNERIAWGES
jgi:hypothetical protein